MTLKSIWVAVGVVAACASCSSSSGGRGAASPQATPSAQQSSTYAFPVVFVNDTQRSVVVVGCPGCEDGHRLRPGTRWVTGVNGGITDVRFDSVAGGRIGCVHMSNGAVPSGGVAPQEIDVAAYIPCRGG